MMRGMDEMDFENSSRVKIVHLKCSQGLISFPGGVAPQEGLAPEAHWPGEGAAGGAWCVRGRHDGDRGPGVHHRGAGDQDRGGQGRPGGCLPHCGVRSRGYEVLTAS